MARSPFNDGWSFTVPRGIIAKMSGEQDQLEPVRLPHDAMRDARSTTAASGPLTAYHDTASYRYEKRFEVPAEWRNKVVKLEFEGVYRDARVFLNDVLVTQHSNGYTGFMADLDAYLRFGEENRVVVEARTHLDARWYSGGGIYRPVWLHVLEPVHLVPGGITVKTPEIDPGYTVVTVSTDIANRTRHTRTVELSTTVVTADGAEIASIQSPVTLLPGQTMAQVHRMGVEHPELWDIEKPYLYRAVTTLVDGQVVTGAVDTSFGIRSLQLDPRHGLRINGREVKLRGGSVHHDNGPLGAMTIDRADERRIELLKLAGFNAVRSSHNPASRALLDACDRLGMLVINEAFDVWTRGKNEFDDSSNFADRWRDDLGSLVRDSRNHPSVIMYSVGNEVMEIGDIYGANLARQLASHLRELDPDRYVTNALQLMWLVVDPTGAGAVEAMNEILGERAPGEASLWATPEIDSRIHEFADVLDVVGYNYADSRFAIDAERFPHRVVYGSETFPSRIASYWDEVMRSPHVIGDVTWTAWDYIGEVGVGAIAYEGDLDGPPAFLREYPHLVAQVGDHDITGVRRPISYYREIVYGRRADPYIAVQPPSLHDRQIVHKSPWAFTDGISSWSWDGNEGAAVRVEVYADADEVALELDGVEIARQRVGGDRAFQATFDTSWVPGVLTAIAYRSGDESGRSALRSAKGDVTLAVDADRATIRAGDDDLAYLELELLDDAGTVWVDQDRSVSLSLDGPGELVGFGTGDPATEEKFGASSRTTYRGRALAVVRPTGPGVVTVTATAEGIQATSVEITVV